MHQIIEFMSNHWIMVSAFLVVLALVIFNELQTANKRVKNISPQAAVQLINTQEAVVLDLRETEPFSKGHIIDAIRVKQDDFTQNKMNKYKEKSIILVCSRGQESANLANSLQAQGFSKVQILAGGITAWQTAGLPLVKGK